MATQQNISVPGSSSKTGVSGNDGTTSDTLILICISASDFGIAGISNSKMKKKNKQRNIPLPQKSVCMW